MSEIIDVPMSGQRSLATVTAEIRAYQDAARRMAVQYSIEIGRRLIEAKEMVGHGEWGAYLREELGFSQSTANNHMAMFRAYAADQMRLDGDNLKNQAFGNLTYTQALALLALPSEEEREAFVESHDMAGLSTRELREELRKRQEAGFGAENEDAEALREKLDDAEKRVTMALDELDEYRMDSIEAKKRASAAEEQLREAERLKTAFKAASDVAEKKAQEAAIRAGQLEKDLREARKAEKDAVKALQEAKDNPTVPPETLEKLRREAEAAAEASHKADYEALEEAKKKYVQAEREASAARQAKEAADKQCLSLRQEKEAAEKALRMAAPEMAVFKERFERVQSDLMTLIRSIDGLPEGKRAGAWRAMDALNNMAKSEYTEMREAAV